MSRATAKRLVLRRDGKRSLRGFSLDAVDHVFTIAWYNVATNERRLAKRDSQRPPTKAEVVVLKAEIAELSLKVHDYLRTCDRLIERERSQSDMWSKAREKLDDREANVAQRERALLKRARR